MSSTTSIDQDFIAAAVCETHWFLPGQLMLALTLLNILSRFCAGFGIQSNLGSVVGSFSFFCSRCAWPTVGVIIQFTVHSQSEGKSEEKENGEENWDITVFDEKEKRDSAKREGKKRKEKEKGMTIKRESKEKERRETVKR